MMEKRRGDGRENKERGERSRRGRRGEEGGILYTHSPSVLVNINYLIFQA